MTPMSDEEWGRVQEALVKGGLRECIDSLLTARPFLSDKNRRIIEQAYDDGDGNGIDLVLAEPYPWFAGMYDGDCEVMLGLEHRGILYSIVHASGGGVCSVIVGDGLINNEIGVAFQDVEAAKAYVEGMTAK